jgi:hypothetical protein
MLLGSTGTCCILLGRFDKIQSRTGSTSVFLQATVTTFQATSELCLFAQIKKKKILGQKMCHHLLTKDESWCTCF